MDNYLQNIKKLEKLSSLKKKVNANWAVNDKRGTHQCLPTS